jgi:hypothetical protein
MTNEKVQPCKRHKWEAIGESEPRLMRSNLTTLYYRWHYPAKCTVCGATKLRPS